MQFKRRAFARAVAWAIVPVVGLIVTAPSANAQSRLYQFNDSSGLSAEAMFTIVAPKTLEIRLRNTSTSAPSGYSSADQLLTGVSWDFGQPGLGIKGEPKIKNGTVAIGPTGRSYNFDNVGGVQLGPNDIVSPEWGYGNKEGTGALANFISAMSLQAKVFAGGVNLDGPVEIVGPQGGIVANPMALPLGSIGAVQSEVVVLLTLSKPMTDLDFLDANLVRFEFGADATYFTVPAPASASVLGLLGLTIVRRRRH